MTNILYTTDFFLKICISNGNFLQKAIEKYEFKINEPVEGEYRKVELRLKGDSQAHKYQREQFYQHRERPNNLNFRFSFITGKGLKELILNPKSKF